MGVIGNGRNDEGMMQEFKGWGIESGCWFGVWMNGYLYRGILMDGRRVATWLWGGVIIRLRLTQLPRTEQVPSWSSTCTRQYFYMIFSGATGLEFW